VLEVDNFYFSIRHSEQNQESRGKNSEIPLLRILLDSGSLILRFTQDDGYCRI